MKRRKKMEQLNLKLTLNYEGSITASWNSISDTTHYMIYMYTQLERNTIYIERNLAGTATSYTSVPNLKANTVYKVVLAAYSDTQGVISDGGDVLILSDFYKHLPLGIPENIEETAYSSSVRISFDRVDRASSYDILFDNKVYPITTWLDRISMDFSGLTPKTAYNYAIRAKNLNQTGEYSEVRTIVTDPNKPVTPTCIVKSVTQNSVTISWRDVKLATSYEVVFNGATYRVNDASITLSGLAAGTTYKFKIRGVYSEAVGTYTHEIPITTAG